MYAILDNGCQSTLLREKVAREIGLHGDPVPIDVTTMLEKVEVDSKDVSLTVFSTDGTNKFEVDSVFVVPSEKSNMPAYDKPVRIHCKTAFD